MLGAGIHTLLCSLLLYKEPRAALGSSVVWVPI